MLNRIKGPLFMVLGIYLFMVSQRMDKAGFYSKIYSLWGLHIMKDTDSDSIRQGLGRRGKTRIQEMNLLRGYSQTEDNISQSLPLSLSAHYKS